MPDCLPNKTLEEYTTDSWVYTDDPITQELIDHIKSMAAEVLRLRNYIYFRFNQAAQ